MLIPPKLLIKSINTFVSPHGLTDYIHAKQFNLLEDLYRINTLSLASAQILSILHFKPLLHGLFVSSAIVHFRNDMPYLPFSYLNKINSKLLLSGIFMTTMINLPPDFFAYYMLFIHTPNHYKLSLEFIKNNLNETLFLIGFVGIILGNLELTDQFINNIFPLIQGLVIAHIIYEESYIFNDFNFSAHNYFKDNVV